MTSLARDVFRAPKSSGGSAGDRRRKPRRAIRAGSLRLAPADPSITHSVDRPMRVLIVEDDPYSREILKDTLEHEGHEASVAARRGDAIRMLKKGLVPDVILLDLMMPGMSADEFCGRLYEMSLANIPVVAISAADEGEVATPIHAVARMSKPINITDLLASVKKSIKKKR
jgi:CheY-like chemotaxis protein